MTIALEDRILIQELISSYNQSIDHFDSKAWAALFTQDGALQVGQITIAKGHVDLMAYLEKRRLAGGPRLRHWVTNVLIEGSGKSVRMRAYVMAFNISERLEAPYVMGEYDDELVKEDSGWKFKLRRLEVVAGLSTTSRVQP